MAGRLYCTAFLHGLLLLVRFHRHERFDTGHTQADVQRVEHLLDSTIDKTCIFHACV